VEEVDLVFARVVKAKQVDMQQLWGHWIELAEG